MSLNANVHIKEDLRWSLDTNLERWWKPFYLAAFPTIETLIDVSDRDMQTAGVDKIMVLKGGFRHNMEEKVRKNRDPRDILLEYHHVADDRDWAGWVEKDRQLTDFVCMGFLKTNTAFFIPFMALRVAWIRHQRCWKQRYSLPPVPNPPPPAKRDWVTHCVAVPVEELSVLLCDPMIKVQL